MHTSNFNPRVHRKPAPAAPSSCPHHWHIDKPDAKTSEGVCQLCGARQMFNNAISNEQNDIRYAKEPGSEDDWMFFSERAWRNTVK